MSDLQPLVDKIKDFVSARDWQIFHTPKNLAMCLSVEASELVELYQWQLHGAGSERPGAGAPDQQRIEEEVGDVLISLLNFCNATGIDPIQAGLNKLEQVKEKYPIEQSKGSAEKPARD